MKTWLLISIREKKRVESHGPIGIAGLPELNLTNWITADSLKKLIQFIIFKDIEISDRLGKSIREIHFIWNAKGD
jgi:hypothetical protein